MIENITMGLYDGMTYNSGCVEDVRRVTEQCLDFKIDVIANMTSRFKIGVIVLISLVVLHFIINYVVKDFELKQFVLKRIEWALIVTALTLTAMFFI